MIIDLLLLTSFQIYFQVRHPAKVSTHDHVLTLHRASEPGSIKDEQPKEGHGIKKSKLQFTHKLLAQEPLNTTGGQVRIADSKGTFPLSKTVAAAHLLLQPNAMREMHWHPQADEWSFFIRGRARVTIFASEGTARTFDYGPGDVGIVPKNMGHFIENLDPENELEVLEIFRSDEFLDFSLFDWMGKFIEVHEIFSPAP